MLRPAMRIVVLILIIMIVRKDIGNYKIGLIGKLIS